MNKALQTTEMCTCMVGPPGREFIFELETTKGRFGSKGQLAGSTRVHVDEETGRVTVRTVAFPGMAIDPPPSVGAVERTVARMRAQQARKNVLENVDLVALVLSHAELDPKSFVGVGMVSKTWRAASRVDASLLLKAAKSQRFLTKRVFQGLFGLTPAEADQFPHGTRAYKMGFMFMYKGDAINAVMGAIGGMCGWEQRMAQQAARHLAQEQRFGSSRWRERQWSPGRGAKRRLEYAH